ASQAIVEDYTYNLSTTPIKPNTYGNPSAFYSGKDFGHTLVTAVSMVEGFLGAAGGVVTSPTGVGAVAGSAAVAMRPQL
ncbi:MAG: hypothetical protein ACOYVD_17255, partial [Bacillota bacterium]